MQDLAASIIDRLSLLFDAPPWIVLLTLVFVVVLIVGIGIVLREGRAAQKGPNWDRDPDEMRDLSPHLRRARLQMIAAGIAMVFILIIAALNLMSN